MKRTAQNSIEGCNDYVISLALRKLPPPSVKSACTPGFRKVCGSCVACIPSDCKSNTAPQCEQMGKLRSKKLLIIKTILKAVS